MENLLLQTHLNQTIIALNPTSMFQSLSHCRPSFNAELSSVSEFLSAKKAYQFCDSLRTVLDKHAPPSLQKVINHNSSPWFESIRDELSIAISERRQVEWKWRNTQLLFSRTCTDR